MSGGGGEKEEGGTDGSGAAPSRDPRRTKAGRIGRAFDEARRRGAQADPAPPERPEDRPLVGNFARMAYMQTRGDLKEARAFVIAALARGDLVLRIPPDQIVEGAAAGGAADDAALAALARSLEREGQREPVLVRPLDPGPGRQPDASYPWLIDRDERFALVDGRRRLAACRRLGVAVRCRLLPDGNTEDGGAGDGGGA